MAERRLAERPAMQLVGLDEDATDAPPPVRSAPEHLHDVATGARSWASRRPAVASVVTVAVLALVAGVALAGPRWLTERERAAVLGPAAFVGAVATLRTIPEATWTADVNGTTAPVLVGDVLVASAGSVRHRDRRIVGLDAISGALRWTVPLGTDPQPDAIDCHPTGEVVSCLAGPAPTPDPRDLAQVPDGEVGVATLWAIDPVHGVVRSTHPVPGWIQSSAAAGSDLVVAAYAHGRLSVSRIEPVSGRQVWQTQRFATAGTTINGRIRLVVARALVMATDNDSTLLLDAATGERQTHATDTLGIDQTRLAANGTVVRTQFRLRGPVIVASSSLSDGMGEPWLTAEGSVLSVDVSDGSSGLTFTSDGFGLDGVRAYRPGADQQVWQTPTQATRVSVDASDRVVVRNGGTVAGLAAEDGGVVWVRDLGAVSGPTVSDGRRVAVLSGGIDERPVLVALDLADGTLEWRLPLPAGTSRLVQLGTQLYAIGDERLVALR
ncbi:PQQ-binding-like beta-propeller repeat protein [Cellulomonas sp. McL0617]|uniref:outer membrane protein assembly factor BamB family protein n=1 Tax=Cellulomonas sp. McL0617 TaxID=3415675 RepID=UPI003CE680BF